MTVMRRTLACFAFLAVIASASCKPKPKPGQGAYLPRLAQIIANPKSAGPSSTKDEKDAVTYTYPDAPGVQAVTMTVAKERAGAWRLTMQAPGTDTFAISNFAPRDVYPPGSVELPKEEWFELGDGPLKGNVVHLPGFIGSIGTPGHCTSAEIFSPQFFLTKAFAFKEPAMMRWACESGRAGIKAIAVREFLDQCEEAVRAKLLLPATADFHVVGIENQVLASAECDYAWKSSVDSKNGLGASVSHAFTCSYAPKKGHVEASIAR